VCYSWLQVINFIKKVRRSRMNKKELLSLKDINVWYKKEHPVIKDLSLEVFCNEVVGLIGLNGAGKTTLFKTMLGLIDGFEANTIKWNEKNIGFRDRNFKKNRYIVFAEDRSFGYFTFREYLKYVFKSYGKKLEDVSELVEGFHFGEYTDALMKELSTGNRKKAYLITAFALRTEFLLLDEPVNGLDFQSTEYLYKLINDYRKYGTVLFSSHILESICLTSDRVMVLEGGRIDKIFEGDSINGDVIREVLKQ